MNGKPILAAACAISLACGYIAGKAVTASRQENDAAPSHQSRPDRPSSRETRTRGTDDGTLLDSILGGRAIGEIPAADLADSVSSDPEAKKTGAISSVISALAGKDPASALDWLSAQEEPSPLFSTVIGVIARDDPQAAKDLLRKSLLDGSLSNNQLWSATYGIGLAMAKLGVDPLLSFIDSLPGQQQSNVASNAILQMPEGERIRFMDELHQRKKDGRLPGMRLEYLFTSILSTDEAGAIEWFEKLPDGQEKNSLRLETATSLMRLGEKESAATWMREALDDAPGNEKQILGEVIQNMSYNNPEGIAYFAKLLPDGVEFTAKDMENHASNPLYYGTHGLTAIASAIKDPGEKARLIAGALEKISTTSGRGRHINANDLEILSHKVAAMGYTGEDARLVNDALEAARNPSANP